MPKPQRLLKRADFLACSRGRRWQAAAFALQAGPNGDDGRTRLGFTVSKKNGNAVIRNRIKRRLKAAAGALPPDAMAAGYDYVIVARPEALTSPFVKLRADLAGAFDGVRRPREARSAKKTALDGDTRSGAAAPGTNVR
jgi:ribonuclease P protein component